MCIVWFLRSYDLQMWWVQQKNWKPSLNYLTQLGRFRVNAFNQSRGCSAVFRTIPVEIPYPWTARGPRDLERISNYEKGFSLWWQLSINLCVSRQLWLRWWITLNRNHNKHILTIEDPIEFVHTNNKMLNQPPRRIMILIASKRRCVCVTWRSRRYPCWWASAIFKRLFSLALTAAETGHQCLVPAHELCGKKLSTVLSMYSWVATNIWCVHVVWIVTFGDRP